MTTPRTATPAERFAEKTAELTAAMTDLGHAIVAANARQSAHYAAVAEKFGTAFPTAGPDLDDLDADQVDADMLGLTQCSQCDWNFLDEEINYGCTDVNQSCFECHEELCTDRTCREEYEDWAADR